MLMLTVIQGPDKGKRFTLPDDEPQMIGRSSESIPLTDMGLSRRHAELTPDGQGQWFLRDLGSVNGTYVNEGAVTSNHPALLHPGDRIQAGQTVLAYGPAEVVNPLDLMLRAGSESEMDAQIEATASAAGSDSLVMAWPSPSEAAHQQIDIIYRMVNLAGLAENREMLLASTMDLLFKHFTADQGFILLLKEPGNIASELLPAAIRVNGALPVPGRPILFSQSVAQWVLAKQEAVLSVSAMTDPRFAEGDSIQAMSLRSVIAVPIQHQGLMLGILELDSAKRNYSFTRDQLMLMTAIGVQIGLALNNLRLIQERVEAARLMAVGEAVASLSHSIKNMLQAMKSGSDLVEMGMRKDSPELLMNGWDIVSRSHDRFYRLAMNMLQFSKQRQPEMGLYSLQSLLGDLAALLTPRFQTRNCRLIIKCSPGVPPIPFELQGIHQALLNLLSNALDAVPPANGQVTLSARYEPGKDNVSIRVTDNGPGLPEAIRSNPFTAFQSTKGYAGTGLGLPVAKKIAEEHGGTLVLESPPGEGLTAILTLQVKKTGRSLDDTH